MRVYSALLSVVALGLAASSVSANVINETNTYAGIDPSLVYSGTGPASTGTIWNQVNFNSSGSNLVYSGGSGGSGTSGVGFSVVGAMNGPASDGTSGNRLMDDFTYTNTPGGMFTISGLTPGWTYDLYLFGAKYSDESPSFVQVAQDWTKFTVDTVGSLSTDGQLGVNAADPLAPPSNYTSSSIPASEVGHAFVEFASVSPNGLNQITGEFADGPGSPSGIFNGFELVENRVPEPASLGTLGVGALALMRRRRGVSH